MNAQIELQNRPLDLMLQQAVDEVGQALKEFDNLKANTKATATEKSGIKNDKCNRPFFSPYKANHKSTDIATLFDEANNLHKEWDGLADTASAYLENLFIIDSRPRRQRIECLLDKIMKQIPMADRLKLDAPFSDAKLKTATSRLAKGKAPSPNDIPIKFYLKFWEWVGPTILVILKGRITEGKFDEAVTIGFIILLQKRGDEWLLSNKRVLTLLNTLYKIFTKAYQLRLTPILNNFISLSHSAFLLGCSIHHTLLLTNELLHKASLSEKAFILLKLDIHKAFDFL